MSKALTLPFDKTVKVRLFATTASGAKVDILPGSTVTSDNSDVSIVMGTDSLGSFYTATANAQAGSANITLAPPTGISAPLSAANITPDVSVFTIGPATGDGTGPVITGDPVVSQGQDIDNAVFVQKPSPPTS